LICFNNAQSVISEYEKIKRPLPEHMIGVLNEIEAEIKIMGLQVGFYVIKGVCRICNHDEVIIYPKQNNITNSFECSNCGNMSVEEEIFKE